MVRMTLATGRGKCGFLILATLPVLAQAVPGAGKPIHFEQVKSKLIASRIRCTDCHLAHDDPSLTRYGALLAEGGADLPMRERVLETETSPSQKAPDAIRERAAGRIDVDGDGIPNWVEILAGTSPSDASERQAEHDRIERVISCHLCHESVEGGVNERAPHNAFGDALESLAPKRGNRDDGRVNQPILPRLKRRERSDTDKDRIKDWDEVLLFFHPADGEDTPDADAVKAFKRAQRDRRRDDEGFGRVHEPKGRRDR